MNILVFIICINLFNNLNAENINLPVLNTGDRIKFTNNSILFESISVIPKTSPDKETTQKYDKNVDAFFIKQPNVTPSELNSLYRQSNSDHKYITLGFCDKFSSTINVWLLKSKEKYYLFGPIQIIPVLTTDIEKPTELTVMVEEINDKNQSVWLLFSFQSKEGKKTFSCNKRIYVNRMGYFYYDQSDRYIKTLTASK